MTREQGNHSRASGYNRSVLCSLRYVAVIRFCTRTNSSRESSRSIRTPNANGLKTVAFWYIVRGIFFKKHRRSRLAVLRLKHAAWFVASPWLASTFAAHTARFTIHLVSIRSSTAPIQMKIIRKTIYFGTIGGKHRSLFGIARLRQCQYEKKIESLWIRPNIFRPRYPVGVAKAPRDECKNILRNELAGCPCNDSTEPFFGGISYWKKKYRRG